MTISLMRLIGKKNLLEHQRKCIQKIKKVLMCSSNKRNLINRQNGREADKNVLPDLLC